MNCACLCAWLSVCVGAATGDRPEEIYITKHPQVHGEISNIQMRAGSIKGWFQDVIEGEEGEAEEKKEANCCSRGCTQKERARPKKRQTRLLRMKEWRCKSQTLSQVFTHRLKSEE